MFIDGFSPDHARAPLGLSSGVERRFYALVAGLARRIHVEIDGVERVPPGKALLVANHCAAG